MAREERAKTKGSAFVQLVKKDEQGQWTDMVLVHNLTKPMPDGRPKDPGRGMPGGGIREDEDLHEGAVRELFEETNAILNIAKELMKEFAGREHELDYLEYMSDEDREKVLTIRRFEKMSEDLDNLTRRIKKLPEGSPKLKEEVEDRNKIIREYAVWAKKLGLIKMVGEPKEETGRSGDKHWVYIFEVNAEDVSNLNDLSTRNDLAGNVDAVMWVAREEVEYRARNFKQSFEKPDYIYRSHLIRMGLAITG